MTKGTQKPPLMFTGALVGLSVIAFISTLGTSQLLYRVSHEPELLRALQQFRTDGGGARKSRTEDSRQLTTYADENIKDEASSHRQETPIANPLPQSGYDTFSACLLVMDDNPRLVEWMAYHYHLLPLRYLVVAVDPRSRTSPTAILNRYRRMGVYIEEWTDHDFLDAKLAKNVIPDDARFQVKRDRHRARQKVFYRSCLINMKNANRTYVTLHDTDEYLVYNHAGGNKYDDWERQMQARHDQSRNKNKVRIKPSRTPPTTADEGSLLKYIRQEKAAYNTTACISVPRLHFGAVESTPEEQAKDVPSEFDPEQFDTLRWRKHSKRNDYIKNNLAKVIIDVSEVDMVKTPRFRSLHRPIPKICPPPWVNDWETGIRLNHYLGSWESFSFRDDSRRGGERSRETWEFQAADQDDTDDNVRPWLDGFVKAHGQDTAKLLLRDVGLPKGYRNENESAWKYMWIDDILQSNETEGTNPKNHEFGDFIRRRQSQQNLTITPSAGEHKYSYARASYK